MSDRVAFAPALLLIETPEPTLSRDMKWVEGKYVRAMEYRWSSHRALAGFEEVKWIDARFRSRFFMEATNVCV
jgi:hypothetical protein